MFSIIRKRVTYVNVAMTLALVFTMTGGAYAASKYVITSTKQIKPSVLKTLQGKAGAKGPQGPAGTTGLAGPAGAAGPTGLTGKEGPAGKGINGTSGTNGTSVTSKELTSSDAACNKEGGSEFTAAESKKTTACNGKTGFTTTLPSGKTETGAWVVQGTNSAAGEFKRTAVSFTIPLAVAPESVTVVAPNAGTLPTGCKGSAAQPEAEPGVLCIFESEAAGYKGGLTLGASVHPGGFGAGTTGAELLFGTSAPTTVGEEVTAEGTWAVTAK